MVNYSSHYHTMYVARERHTFVLRDLSNSNVITGLLTSNKPEELSVVIKCRMSNGTCYTLYWLTNDERRRVIKVIQNWSE